MLHILAHFLLPLVVAKLFFRQLWLKAYLLMMVTMLVDLDHLLATPVYDASRCSIGFHPLHQPVAILIYVGLCFFSRTRLLGIGLVIHMLLDSIDCQVTNGVWIN